jgi:hypothetical protein
MTGRVPELPAYLMLGLSMGQPAAYYLVWCKHCRRQHRHAAGDGHRTAHCIQAGNAASPYNVTGYWLRCTGTANCPDDVMPVEERERRLMRRMRRGKRRS